MMLVGEKSYFSYFNPPYRAVTCDSRNIQNLAFEATFEATLEY